MENHFGRFVILGSFSLWLSHLKHLVKLVWMLQNLVIRLAKKAASTNRKIDMNETLPSVNLALQDSFKEKRTLSRENLGHPMLNLQKNSDRMKFCLIDNQTCCLMHKPLEIGCKLQKVPNHPAIVVLLPLYLSLALKLQLGGKATFKPPTIQVPWIFTGRLLRLGLK
ncbi:unnamed protein product [Citrullus colocynthis]|uniref:Uncharacterized protein n=1 Tax=Citrullus colocynthis TaxID=252529 RepID=A0ABP0Y9Q2_9ROSI